MIDKLFKMAKQNFDLAFVIAEKYNLEKELFNNLKGNYDLSFSKLKQLITKEAYNGLDYLDICYNLQEYNVDGRSIQHLDMSDNLKLNHLTCDNCNISELNISKNKELVYLSCSLNNLIELDLTNNEKLEYFYFMNNKNKINLDLSKNTLIKTICCLNVKELDLSKQTMLKKVVCDADKLILNKSMMGKETSYDITKLSNTKIEYVE